MWNIFGEGPIAPDASVIECLLGGEESDHAWRDLALCAQTDPDAFYPEKGGSTLPAKAVCANCEVRQQCLEFALEHDERYGIWGGMSDRERRRYKRNLGK
ncbi:MAG: WhiB family transcriptional regulator [Buchananella hordeovulneris]|nr:WhiB family transcriptional regulator [Buchananella hordeovulneris]